MQKNLLDLWEVPVASLSLFQRSMVYRILAEAIVIIAVAPDARKPRYWESQKVAKLLIDPTFADHRQRHNTHKKSPGGRTGQGLEWAMQDQCLLAPDEPKPV